MNSQSTHIDQFIFLFCALTLIGTVFVCAGSTWYATERTASALYFSLQQGVAVLCAALTALLFYFVPSAVWRHYAPVLFGLTLAGLLARVVSPGLGHSLLQWLLPNGWSIAWSELVKITASLYLATFLAKRQYTGWTFTRGFMPLCVIFGFCSVLMMQQDLHVSAVILLLSVVAVCFVAQRAPLYVLAVFSSAMLYGIWAVWQHPEWVTPHAGYTPALICLGAAGWSGAHTVYGQQLLFCQPSQQSPLIFSLLAGQVGFVGSLFLLGLFLLFFSTGIRVVQEQTDLFCAYAMLSLLAFTALQVSTHLLYNVGVPLSGGVVLPFISFGARGLISQGVLLGLALKRPSSSSGHMQINTLY